MGKGHKYTLPQCVKYTTCVGKGPRGGGVRGGEVRVGGVQ